jgi:hypothetical protein
MTRLVKEMAKVAELDYRMGTECGIGYIDYDKKDEIKIEMFGSIERANKMLNILFNVCDIETRIRVSNVINKKHGIY